MKVIYFVGMGRSGSTLLDLQLDAHSNVCSLGGVRRMLNALDRQSCACGVPTLRECGFWSDIDDRLHQRLNHGLDRLRVHARDSATFRRHNTALFEAAAEAAGVEFIVDSSKSVSRLGRLLKETDIEILPVHIVRDARGYAYSQQKRKSESIAPALSYTNRSIRTYTLLRKRPHVAVEYAHLAGHNSDCLQKLSERLGIGFEPGQLDWANRMHHNVGGGAILKRPSGNTIRFDTQWREALGLPTQTLIKSLALPGDLANYAKARRWGLP